MSTHPSSAFLKILNKKAMKQEVYTDYENIKEFSPVVYGMLFLDTYTMVIGVIMT